MNVHPAVCGDHAINWCPRGVDCALYPAAQRDTAIRQGGGCPGGWPYTGEQDGRGQWPH